jgi:hypothetical protein
MQEQRNWARRRIMRLKAGARVLPELEKARMPYSQKYPEYPPSFQ